MNNCIFYGRICTDIDVRYTNDEMAIATFSLAIDRNQKKEEGKQSADFARIKAFGKTAETISKYFEKGSPILLQCRFQSGSYTNQNGDKVFTNDFIVDRFEFTAGRKNDDQQDSRGSGRQQRDDRRSERRGSGRSQQRPPRQQRMDDYDDDLPEGFAYDEDDIPF